MCPDPEAQLPAQLADGPHMVPVVMGEYNPTKPSAMPLKPHKQTDQPLLLVTLRGGWIHDPYHITTQHHGVGVGRWRQCGRPQGEHPEPIMHPLDFIRRHPAPSPLHKAIHHRKSI